MDRRSRGEGGGRPEGCITGLDEPCEVDLIIGIGGGSVPLVTGVVRLRGGLVALDPFLDRPPREPVRPMEIGGYEGEKALRDVAGRGAIGPPSSVGTAVRGVAGMVKVLPSAVMAGVGRLPSAWLLTDLLRRLRVGAGASMTGSA